MPRQATAEEKTLDQADIAARRADQAAGRYLNPDNPNSAFVLSGRSFNLDGTVTDASQRTVTTSSDARDEYGNIKTGNKTAQDQLLKDKEASDLEIATAKTDLADLIAQREAKLEARRKASEDQINTNAATEKANTEQAQKSEIGARTLQLAKYGALGNTTGSANLQSLAASQRAEISAIDAKRQNLINQANAAYEDKDFELAKFKLTEEKALREERAQRYAEFAKQTSDLLAEQRAEDQAAREATKFEQEQTLQNVIPNLYEELTDNPADAQSIFQSYVDAGYNPLQLSSQLIAYRTDREKADLLNATATANLLSGTELGGTVNIPGIGDVKILGVQDKAPTTLETANGKIMQWSDGKWTDTGLTKDILTPTEIFKFLETFEDPTITKNYLKEIGIDVENGIVSSSTGDSYDIKNYATNPEHAASVQRILNEIGKIENPEEIDSYIESVAPNSPITSQMIQKSSEKYGVSWEMMIAAMQQDSNFGTVGAAVRSKNPGNVGNTDTAVKTGKLNMMSSWQAGVDALAKNLAGRKTTAQKTGDTFDTFSKEQIALSALPVQTRNSEVELKRALTGIKAGLAQGLTPYQIADNLMGYKVNQPDDFSDTIRGYISQSDGLTATDPGEFARMINAGNKAGVINKLETKLLSKTDGGKKKEAIAGYSKTYGDKAIEAIQNNLDKMGIVEGNYNKLQKKFKKSEDFQKLSSTLAALVSEWRHEMIGSAATDTELKMIAELIPQVSDNPFNAIEKVKELQYMNLTSANSIRQSVNLPALKDYMLGDYNNRIELYSNSVPNAPTTNQPWKSQSGKSYTLPFLIYANKRTNSTKCECYGKARSQSRKEIQEWLDSMKNQQETENPIMNLPKTPEQKKAAFGAAMGQSGNFIDKIIGFTDNLQQKSKSNFDKFSGALEGASDIMFGSTGKTAGGLITKGIGGATQLSGQITGNDKLVETGSKIQKAVEDPTKTDIAFTALELYPGGGLLVNQLKKIPQGAKLAEAFNKTLKFIPAKLKASAIEQYAKVLAPTTNKLKAKAAKVIPELLNRGIKTTSIEKLRNKASKLAGAAGKELGSYVEKLPATLKSSTADVFTKLDTLASKYTVDGKVIKQEAVNAIDNVKQALGGKAKTISQKSLQKFKQIFTEHYDAAKGLDDITTYAKKAERAASDAIRKVLHLDNPTLGKLDAEYSFWKGVADVAGATTRRKFGQLKQEAAGTIVGGVTGATVGEGLKQKAGFGVLGALLGDVAVKAFKSPAWRTTSAVVKNDLANKILKGDMDGAILILNRIITGTKNAIE